LRQLGKDEIMNMFAKTGALLEGHFRLSSGLHSGRYLQCALLLQHPEYAARLGAAIAGRFKGKEITCVAGPALGGIVIAHETARALGVRCVFGEREDGRMVFRRGFKLTARDKVLVVEDVVTTGRSIKELIEAIKAGGAAVTGIGAIVDRSSGGLKLDCAMEALAVLDIPTLDPSECPLCEKGIPLVKPGSRK